MELLEQTTSSNLGSIIEPLTSISNNETSISTLENEFNTTLVKYITTYKLLMNEILTNSNNRAASRPTSIFPSIDAFIQVTHSA